ncbi:glucose dehydrogenase [FAD, quinone]-like isoform X1 [Diorhabda sublineata]|uniref:glucose dehydrogenase [FAD, quinone]-like isoform X1 n=1 Tax=Diorhabda sublineata TaxID=1163346 RepID=UPI0024E062C6|nr:glucose dehydrogenase [FAD, quinone]-like isoform X1 [Diorhabda sublineata]
MVFRTKRIYSVVFAVFVFVNDAAAVAEEEISYYENLINEELEKAEKFELPTNANIHRPLDDTIRDFGTFDFVVIGAGSTGSVIASRLSEIAEWRILLLEAGGYPNNFTMIPAMFAIQALTNYNWGFLSTPQKTACLGTIDKRCVIPRGKGMGGTSLINQSIYSRGNPIDYNRWAQLINDPTWKYENVIKYFKKSEDFHKTNPDAPVDWEFHGRNGYLYTNYQMPPSNCTKIFLRANREIGKNITDYNGKRELGATVLQINTKNGKRFDQATAFIGPIKNRNNLIISTGSYAIKIEVVHKRAVSVIFTKNKRMYRVAASREIILSAGAVSSPQILMLSGIGPKKHLKDLNIPVIQDLPVGNRLRDHVFCGIQFSSKFDVQRKNITENIREYLRGYGDLTTGNTIDAAGFYKSSIERISSYPDLEIVVSSSYPNDFGRKYLRWNEETWDILFRNNSSSMPLTLTPVLLHSKSFGNIRLVNKNPYNYPDINVNILSDIADEDVDTMYEGIQLVLNISKTAIFREIGTKLEVKHLPACAGYEFLSKDFWICFIRQTAFPAFHPVGTCQSGRNPKRGAVVDKDLNVFGLKRLRVADASVLPFTFSGHPNAICTMIGEKISDVIKQQNFKKA